MIPKHHDLPEITRGFKTFSARRINEHRNTPGASVWQRNYYEHIIRNEESLNHIRQYILDNAERWAMDRENPSATAPEPDGAWLA
jgi:REP element-mobilizing transposase RayT